MQVLATMEAMNCGIAGDLQLRKSVTSKPVTLLHLPQ